VLPFVAATGFPGYSHRSQYISELGAVGAPDGVAVSVAFFAVGALFVAWAAVVAPRVAAAAAVGGVTGAATAVAVWLAGGGLGASYAVSAVARCEPGCPDEGIGGAQLAHNLVSSAGYTLAIAALVVFGLVAVRQAPQGAIRRVGRAGLLAAPVLAVVGLAIPVAGDWRGLLQRLLDAGLYAWILAAAHLAATAASPPVDESG
jgi:hypothetical protein